MSAESAEERFIRGFSLKIEGSEEQNGSMIGFIQQKSCNMASESASYSSMKGKMAAESASCGILTGRTEAKSASCSKIHQNARKIKGFIC